MADQIDEVKSKTDIVDLIGGYIELKKAGRNFKALCPFHGEKTPSFMVSPELQMYKCFGCDHKGDVFNFLEEYEGMEFGEALKFLADRAGVKLRPLSFKPTSEKERIYEVNSLTAKFYHYVLTKHRAGRAALNYLKKERGMTETAIETFQLGFCPNLPFAARRFLVEKHKIKIDELARAGLVYQKGREAYDRFRGRVIFPLDDHRGNTIGFAGRILPADEKKDLAKYINTPETPAYHKGSVLYGLNISRSEIKRSSSAVVVEGELDLISSWQVGIKNIVALKGTAMTEDAVRLLSRFAQKITLALDADIAGDAAARRGITMASNLGLEVRVCELKKYKDPDEAARADPKYLKETISKAVNVWDFIIDSVFGKFGAQGGNGKAKISREIVPILAGIDDHIVQAHYAKVVADKLDVPIAAVTQAVEEFLKKTPAKTKSESKKETPTKDRRTLLEERLLAIIFQSDPTKLKTLKTGSLITTPLAKRILESYAQYCQNHKKFDAVSFTKNLPSELVNGFSEIMLIDIRNIIEDPDLLKKELGVVVRELTILTLKEKLVILGATIKSVEANGQAEELEKVKKAFAKYSQELSSLEEKV